MPERESTPGVGPVHWAWHAAGAWAVLVAAAWLGVRGLGEVVGEVLALAALVALLIGLVCGVSWFAGWAVAEIRHEMAAANGGRVGETPLTAAERMRRSRDRRRHEPVKGRSDGRLEVDCWCHAEVLLVPAELVREGLTGSCGREACDRLAGEAQR